MQVIKLDLQFPPVPWNLGVMSGALAAQRLGIRKVISYGANLFKTDLELGDG